MLLKLSTIIIIAILVDFYVIRYYILPSHISKGIKRAVKIYAVALHLLFITSLLLYDPITNLTHHLYLKVLMWIIWFYLFNFLPNLTFALTTLPGRVFGKIRRVTEITGLVLGLIIGVVMIYGATLGRSQVVVNEHSLSYDKLPEELSGMKIAVISDLHLGNIISPEKMINRVVKGIMEHNPDMIVVAGDVININVEEMDERMQAILSNLKAPMGVFVVLGNHDLGVYARNATKESSSKCVNKLLSTWNSMGWTPLVNSSVMVDGISVSGLNFPLSYKINARAPFISGADFEQTYRNVPDSLFNITISHSPQLWDEVLALGYGDLVISGHVHSMQMKLKIFGRQWSLAHLLYRHWSGLYSDSGSNLYVNDGIGCVAYPMRIGANPEITILTIDKK